MCTSEPSANFPSPLLCAVLSLLLALAPFSALSKLKPDVFPGFCPFWALSDVLGGSQALKMVTPRAASGTPSATSNWMYLGTPVAVAIAVSGLVDNVCWLTQ